MSNLRSSGASDTLTDGRRKPVPKTPATAVGCARNRLRRSEEDVSVKPGLTLTALAALLGWSLSPWALAQQTQQQPLPDGPKPQPDQAPLTSLTGPIKPGAGAGEETGTSGSSDLPMNGNSGGTQQAPPPPVPPQNVQ